MSDDSDDSDDAHDHDGRTSNGSSKSSKATKAARKWLKAAAKGSLHKVKKVLKKCPSLDVESTTTAGAYTRPLLSSTSALCIG